MRLNIDALRAALTQPKTAIHCDTEEKAAALFEAMGWGKYANWQAYRSLSCYILTGESSTGWKFGGANDLTRVGYTILTLDDYILPNEPLICKALGVKVGQEFRFDRDPYKCSVYCVGSSGLIAVKIFPSSDWDMFDKIPLVHMINNPHLIRILPHWTEDDIADADAVMRIFPDYKWVARDKDGVACAYVKEPTKKNGAFYPSGCFCFLPSTTAFPSVTWENSPVKLEEIK